jgi:parallel beta-helix repeat protein
MNKGVICILICMLMMFTTVVPITATTGWKKTVEPLLMGNVLYVGGSGPNNYTKILDAINVAVSGDTILVYHGIYHENLWVSKSISLIGENRETTIIDGAGGTNVVRLIANNILLSGFTIRNSAENGVYIYGENITVSGNIFSNNSRDIWLSRSNNTITENLLYGGGLDVYYYFGHNNIVTNNYVHGKPLLYLESKKNMMVDIETGQIILIDCENITIHNQFLSHTAYGILLGGSRHCTISQNMVSNCFIGIQLFRSDNNEVSSNTLADNPSFGIQLLNSSCNTVSQNTISGSMLGSGIYFQYYSRFNSISNNTLLSNRDGIHISTGPTIMTNNHLMQNQYGICLYNCSATYKNDSASYSIIQENHISQGKDGDGIFLYSINHCNIYQNTISDQRFGIEQLSCRDNNITYNVLSNNSWSGIKFDHSTGNVISGNTEDTSNIGISFNDSFSNHIIGNSLKKNSYGIHLDASSNNMVKNNEMMKNMKGISLYRSNDNTVSQNNFRKNEQQAFFLDCNNSWDANYWNRIRFFPYPIVGKKTVTILDQIDVQLPNINFDSHPALRPYNI